MPRTSAVHCVALCALLLPGVRLCSATAITAIELVNYSSPGFAQVNALRAREFQTQVSAPARETASGDTVSFTSHVAWMSSHRVFPGPSGLPLTHGNLVEYDLIFTVEDPSMRGYELQIGSTIRGYVNALWEANVGVFSSLVFSSGTLMAATFDDGTGGVLLPDISTDVEVATATPANPFVELLVARSGTHDAGHYVGTRTFRLHYGSVANNTGVALQNYNIGEGNVRFGLSPTLGDFRNAGYPGPDGESADQHGHFLTVTADFGPTAAVPEPGTFGAIAIALFITPLLKRKRG